MKKLLIAFILFTHSFIQAQQEIKVDLFDALVFKTVEISYEQYLNEESSIGISVLFNSDTDADVSYNEKSMITPYFRHYFSSAYNWNFFGEIFFGINSGDKEIALEGLNVIEDYTDGALGVALGYKYASSRGFVVDIHGGLGRNLFSSNSPEIVPRIGVNVGYRF